MDVTEQGSQPPWPNVVSEYNMLIQTLKRALLCGSLTSYRHKFCSTPDTCWQTHTTYFCSLWMVSMNHFSRYLSGGEELYLVTDTVCSRGTFFIVKRGIVFCFSFVILMFFSTWKSRFLERGYWLMVEFNHLYYFPPSLLLLSLPCSSAVVGVQPTVFPTLDKY